MSRYEGNDPRQWLGSNSRDQIQSMANLKTVLERIFINGTLSEKCPSQSQLRN